MIKHYVEILYPGIITSESNVKEVESRDPKAVIIPDNAFGFRFLDKEEVALADGEILKGSNKNISRFYYKGKRMTLEDVQREKPEENILISNMKCNRFDSIVWTKFGQAIPLRNGDVVLS